MIIGLPLHGQTEHEDVNLQRSPAGVRTACNCACAVATSNAFLRVVAGRECYTFLRIIDAFGCHILNLLVTG